MVFVKYSMKTPLRQFEDEISAIIDRYAQESDLSVAEMIGALQLQSQVLGIRLMKYLDKNPPKD